MFSVPPRPPVEWRHNNSPYRRGLPGGPNTHEAKRLASASRRLSTYSDNEYWLNARLKGTLKALLLGCVIQKSTSSTHCRRQSAHFSIKGWGVNILGSAIHSTLGERLYVNSTYGYVPIKLYSQKQAAADPCCQGPSKVLPRGHPPSALRAAPAGPWGRGRGAGGRAAARQEEPGGSCLGSKNRNRPPGPLCL